MREIAIVETAYGQALQGVLDIMKAMLDLRLEPEEDDEKPRRKDIDRAFHCVMDAYGALSEEGIPPPKGHVTTDGSGSVRIEWMVDTQGCVLSVRPEKAYVCCPSLPSMDESTDWRVLARRLKWVLGVNPNDRSPAEILTNP